MPKPNFPSLQYQGVGGLSPGRSVLDLSHAYAVDMPFGVLIPIVSEECVPGDVVKFSADVVARMNPSIVPFMHEVNISWHSFFVPYRLVWPKVDQSGDDWESYIVGETWDPEASEFVPVTAVLPVWDYTVSANYGVTSLYDYFGFEPDKIPANGSKPHALWQRAYNLIWNEWYRDEDLQAYIDINTNWQPLNSAFEKDYFTSCRPFQQKGIAPAIPVSGVAEFTSDIALTSDSAFGDATVSSIGAGPRYRVTEDDTDGVLYVPRLGYTGSYGLNDNVVDGVGINMADLRLSMQIQKYLERNARAGNRYAEWLRAHYGVSPKDERLQRPEYLGGGKVPVIVSEVLQTSATAAGSTPQGYMAGHGISVASRDVVSGYRVDEFGVFMVIARVLPRTMYTQGVHRRAVRNSPYEFYHPEFAHLAEQAVTAGELVVTGSSDNEVFGFQARYQEYRTRNSIAVGSMRTSLSFWNLARQFPGGTSLNEQFISCDGSSRDALMERAFAVTSEAPFIVTFGNRIVMSRPMPGLPEPGLMDHF